MATFDAGEGVRGESTLRPRAAARPPPLAPHSTSTAGSASMTRSAGKVTITSVPSRSFDFSVKLPPCMSTRPLTIGRPRPVPCSAVLMASEPRPNDCSTIGISSSGMPGPVSLTLRYCPPEEVQPTLTPISPPCGVNLIALESRLSTICRSARSSAQSRGRVGSIISRIVWFFALARRLQHVAAILDHVGELHRLLVELVAAGLDAREVEDLVDERRAGARREPWMSPAYSR